MWRVGVHCGLGASTAAGTSPAPDLPCLVHQSSRQPLFHVHLKHDVRADLPATAIVITDKTAGHGILGVIVNEAQRRGQLQPPVPLEDWIAGSPPVEFL